MDCLQDASFSSQVNEIWIAFFCLNYILSIKVLGFFPQPHLIIMRAAYLLYFSEAAPENKHLIQIPDKICYL